MNRQNEAGGTALVYFKLIWKKAFLALPRFFLALAVTAAVMAAAMFAMYITARQGSLLPRIQVAVVFKDQDVTTTMAAKLVEGMDSVRSVCEFKYISAEEAEKALSENKVQAILYLNENMYDDINEGVNTPVLIRLPEDSGLAVQTFQDLVAAGISMVQTGESAVYAIGETADTYPTKIPAQTLMDQMISKFIPLALNRSGTWNTVTLSAYGDISVTGFYMITILLAVAVILFGMGFASLYEKKQQTVSLCLRRKGVHVWLQGLARLSAVTFVLWIMLCILTAVLCASMKAAAFRPALLLTLLPAAFSIAGFVHLVYGFVQTESASLIYVILTVLLFVLGGGLFPAALLPADLSGVAGLLPVSIWQRYLADLFWNGFSMASFAKIMLAGLIFAAAGTLGLYKNEA